MRYTTIFFDLDDTLYPADCGLWVAIRERIDLYMVQILGIPADEVPPLRQQLFRQYGTTMRGLQQTRHIDAHHYLNFVHDVPVSQFLSPQPALGRLLADIKQERLIFTNADSGHAQRVMSVLGVSDYFQQVIDILAIAPYCKPHEEAFAIALRLAGEHDPTRCILVDDGPQNLATAHKMGFFTVGVSSHQPLPEAHVTIPAILDLPSALDGRLAA